MSSTPNVLETPKKGQSLPLEQLNQLNKRSNVKGLIQLTGHLSVMAVSGYLWSNNINHPLIGIPSLVVYGFSFASMFATMHETVHRSAFANTLLNDSVAWFAGLLSFYNSTFYSRYHKWHHRFTQIIGKDPELSDPKPTNFKEYLVELSGFNWWVGKIQTSWNLATGKLEDYPYVPENARQEVINSVRWQLAVYGCAIALSLAFQQPWFIIYWLLPLMVGQPILRVILLSEHTGCSHDDNYLTNTRTTLTIFPLRFLMWNMPYHAEHHLYQSIPFHALERAHQLLKEDFTHVDPGYVKVQQTLIAALEKTSL